MPDEASRVGKGRKLSRLLIEPFKQIRFGVYIILICIGFVGASAWLFMSTWSEQYQHVMDLFANMDEEAKTAFLRDDIFHSNILKLIAFFVVFLVVMFLTIFNLTHRYYGPLVSIGRFLDQMVEGDYTARVSIRKKDELQDVARKLNTLAESLERRHGSRK